MSIIKILPEILINQIAAGEVVERASSVIKELVENSLDARANSIIVEIEDAGGSLIKVTDNGFGMSREDAELSLQRHATSKLGSEYDLWNIQTMGFRGEALASISAVSRLSIRTKRAEDEIGVEIDCEGGEILRISETGMPTGTQIFVHDLFFNTPARKKYLKKNSTEIGHISATLTTIALANPSVSIKLVNNGKTVFDLPKVTDLLSRIVDIFGKSTAEAVIPIFFGGSEFQMDGFIGKPLLARSSSRHQYFFVNGRPIQHFLFAHTIKRAYHSMLMENKKPIFFINIKVDPSLIDVNVHPRKLEVRFEDESSMLKILYSSVKTALDKTDLIPKGFSESQRYISDKFPVSKIEQHDLKFSGFDNLTKSDNNNGETKFRYNNQKPIYSNVSDAIKFSRNLMNGTSEVFSGIDIRDNAGLGKKSGGSVKAISQVANSYIIAQDENGLILIDQHAAHERVRYEQLMDQFEMQEKKIQPLLVPFHLELSHDEICVIDEYKHIFEGLGFEIEPFGGKTFVVNEVPACLSGNDVEVVVKGVIDDILLGKDASKFQGKIEEILTYMSCRSAIKFGKSLSLSEMEALILQMDGLKRPYTCPHGRPTMVSLSLGELEKMFGRK